MMRHQIAIENIITQESSLSVLLNAASKIIYFKSHKDSALSSIKIFKNKLSNSSFDHEGITATGIAFPAKLQKQPKYRKTGRAGLGKGKNGVSIRTDQVYLLEVVSRMQ